MSTGKPASNSETDARASARASRLAQAQLDRRAGALIGKALDMAERRDVVALRLCLERILPIRKEPPIFLNLPVAVRSAADAEQLMVGVIEAMLSGDATPSQAARITRPIDAFVRASIAATIERDLAELRKALCDTELSEPGRKP